MTQEMPLLRVRGLTKRYGKVLAISDIDLDVWPGEAVVVMGPSGCGKSTTIRCINRLTEPDSGSVVFDGIEVTQLGEEELGLLRRRIGFVFQGFNLIKRLSSLDNVALSLVIQGVRASEARDKARLVLDRVGLVCEVDKRPEELSGGQQQRVGIARALVSEPELMLWDEPTASLDPILVGEILDVMEALVSARKTTMVVVTHELSFARRVADRVVLMDDGRIVEEGLPGEVFDSPKSKIGRHYQHMVSRWQS